MLHSIYMKAHTTMHEMLSASHIRVPGCQRAFSWESDKQVAQFLSDLQDYLKSAEGKDGGKEGAFYLGHFLFSEKDGFYYVIDGQQRLVTVEIFLAAVFSILQNIGALSDNDAALRKNMMGSEGAFHFSVVEYDDDFFKKCILKGNNLEAAKSMNSLSKRRMLDAYCYFLDALKDKNEETLHLYLDALSKAECTTHVVKDEEDAVRLFILQNDRGKLSTKLELVKAQILYALRSTGEKKNSLETIRFVKESFVNIYKLISTVERFLDEDSVLSSAVSIQMNTLSTQVNVETMLEELKKNEADSEYVNSFVGTLERVFIAFKRFYEDERYASYSLSLLAKHTLLPFIAKAYLTPLMDNERDALFFAIESILLRHKIIGTRARIEERLEEEFRNFSAETVGDVIKKIYRLEKGEKEGEWWWNFWRNSSFETALTRRLSEELTLHLLWRYENLLRKKAGKRYTRITDWEVVKIAADEVKNGDRGYGEIDEEFSQVYLNCLGNYLLVRKENKAKMLLKRDFIERSAVFGESFQAEEVLKMAEGEWNKEKINLRYERLVSIIITSL